MPETAEMRFVLRAIQAVGFDTGFFYFTMKGRILFLSYYHESSAG